jgi:hypothetical protein
MLDCDWSSDVCSSDLAGSAIFGKPDYKAVIDEMRAELAR